MSRFIRPLLLLILVGSVIAGLIYASAFFNALSERNSAPHVQRHSTH